MSTNGTLLTGKQILIFGATASMGKVVAKHLAAEGATVHLSARNLASIKVLVSEIQAAGGKATGAQVDALDDHAVSDYMDGIVKSYGRLDVVLNTIGPAIEDYANGTLAVDLTVEQFMTPVETIVRSQFITAHQGAKRMVSQKSGVLIFVTGSPSRGHVSGATAIGTAFGALETFMENLAFEIGPFAVRSVGLRITANIDSRAIVDTFARISKMTGVPVEALNKNMGDSNFLKVPMTLPETAKAIAFLASDHAQHMTGTVMNSSAGAAMD